MIISESSPSLVAPETSPSPLVAASPSQLMIGGTQNGQNRTHHSYHLTLIPGIGIAVTATAFMMLIVLVVLICRKSRELEYSGNTDKPSMKSFPPPQSIRKFQEGLIRSFPWLWAFFNFAFTKHFLFLELLGDCWAGGF